MIIIGKSSSNNNKVKKVNTDYKSIAWQLQEYINNLHLNIINDHSNFRLNTCQTYP